MSISRSKTIRDLTIEELQKFIEKVIEKKLKALFLDPDYGLDLKERITQKLKASLVSKKRIPFHEVKKSLKLG